MLSREALSYDGTGCVSTAKIHGEDTSFRPLLVNISAMEKTYHLNLVPGFSLKVRSESDPTPIPDLSTLLSKHISPHSYLDTVDPL
jgi:hypothetical protein